MKLVLKILALPVLFVVKVICILGNLLTKVTPREMVAIEKALSVSLAMEQLKKRSPKHKAKRAKE